MREITPAIALELLETWNRHNRPFIPSACRRYEEDMLNDRFLADNGETITFDWNGDLIQGQHRLVAIVRSGKTYRLLVVTGLDPKVRKTVDIGVTRTLGQILAMGGVAHADAVGRAARLLVAYESGSLEFKYQDISPSAQPTKMEVEEYIGSHAEELAEAVLMALDKPYRNQFVKAPGVNTFCIVLFCRQDPELARLFMYRLAHGLKSPTDNAGLDAGDPILTLRALLYKNVGPRRYPMSHFVGLILKTWIAVRDHKPVKQLSIRTTENFPDLDVGWPPAGRRD